MDNDQIMMVKYSAKIDCYKLVKEFFKRNLDD